MSSFNDLQLQTQIEEYEDEMVPYAIREEIIQKAMDIIYEKYLQKQTVRFMVQCASDAIVKFLNIQFYFHHETQPFYDDHPLWKMDEPPKPSVPDKLMSNKAPVRLSTRILEEVGLSFGSNSIDDGEGSFISAPPPFEEIHPPSILPSSSSSKYTESLQGLSSMELDEYLDVNADIFKYLMEQREKMTIEEKITPSSTTPTIRLAREAGINWILEDILKQVFRETEGSEKDFIQFAKTRQLTGKCELLTSNTKYKPRLNLPKIELPELKRTSLRMSQTEQLPAIRVKPDVAPKEKPEPKEKKKEDRTKK